MVHRRYIKKITQLEDAQGNPIKDHNRIEEELENYYKDLLIETNDDKMPVIEKITRNIPSLITREHNEALMRPISQEEVDQVVKEIPPGKAPGPYGFMMDFFHYCWPMIREEVWQVVEESRTSGQVLSSFKATFLMFIPKDERVKHPKKYRPIAPCNII